MPVPELFNKYRKLVDLRSNWESHWQEIADYVLPKRADVNKERSRGDKRTELIYDGTALHALNLLSSSLHGMLTNAATPWFSLRFKNEELATDENNEWLESANQAMYIAFDRSNFQQEVHELYLDLCAFGTACMFIENDTSDLLRFTTRHIKEIYVQENSKGRIDTVFRKCKMQARNVVEMFGEENVGKRIQKVAAKDPYMDIVIIHAVMPNDKSNPYKVDNKSMPFMSAYFDPEDMNMISLGGFEEFPYLIPRWSKSSNEVYGRSPSMIALADIKMINKMSETTIRAAQKQIDPPLLVPDDSFILPIKTTPGGLNFYRSGSRDRIEPLMIQANTPVGLNMEEQRRQAIRQAYFVDQLLMEQSVQMTATEVMKRNEEKMRLLAPVLGRLQSEMLRPLISRSFAILMRQGMLPPAPEDLQGLEIDIEYVSPLAKAQRGQDVQAIVQAMEILSPLNQLAPVMDLLDTDAMAKHIADVLGVPSKVLRSTGEVEQLRQDRQQAQQAQEELNQAEQMAKAAGQATPALKEVMGG